MELKCSENDSTKIVTTKYTESFVVTSSNWKIDNNKCLNDCISTALLSQASNRTNLEDVVSLNSCVSLKSNSSEELCKLEFKLINKQKIARIALVSEASVLEFFKQSGEYATTIFAEFVDDFQDHSVYFAETIIQPPSTEATIKFTRIKNKGIGMWIYGIKLILTETTLEISKSIFDLDVINNFLINTKQLNHKKIDIAREILRSYNTNENNYIEDNMNNFLEKLPINCNSPWLQVINKSNVISQENDKHKIGCTEYNSSSFKDNFDLKTYIDNKLTNLERKLIDRIELIDTKVSQKLDSILKCVELNIRKQ